LVIKVEDDCNENLEIYFDNALNFINEGIEKKEIVLVHCLAGPASFVIAYLIKYLNYNYNDAYNFVKEKIFFRIISDNFG
jgi:protein-tyrosine phosphatase